MKKYMAFMGDMYDGPQGLADFTGDFDSLEEAIASLTTEMKTRDAWDRDYKRGSVWDSETIEQVWNDYMLPDD